MYSTNEPAAQGQAQRVIWTPGFILLFFLTGVLGLSIASQLVLGWTNHLFFANQWALQVLVGLIGLAWLVLVRISRSPWLRVSCIFGLAWSALMTLTILLNAQQLGNGTQLQAAMDSATCLALLGSFIGISVQGTPLSQWDTWLFLLLCGGGTLGLLLLYLLTPSAKLVALENVLPLVALAAALLCWWARPSCWKKQPGPTCLFGLVPAILLSAALLNQSGQNLFLLQVASSQLYPPANAGNFFFAQVVLLCLLLGCLRLIKSELHN